VLLQSAGFGSPREAGQLIAQLQQEGASALTLLGQHFLSPSPESQNTAANELEKIRMQG